MNCGDGLHGTDCRGGAPLARPRTAATGRETLLTVAISLCAWARSAADRSCLSWHLLKRRDILPSMAIVNKWPKSSSSRVLVGIGKLRTFTVASFHTEILSGADNRSPSTAAKVLYEFMMNERPEWIGLLFLRL